MKLVLTAFETKSPDWVATARQDYLTKISHFIPLEWRPFKSPSADRDDASVKLKKESEILLKFLDASDLLVLFDENGTTFADSKVFSEHLKRVVESGKSRVVLAIGGPYGFSEDVKKRAQMKWSLSKLTMNHWIAQIAALEQVYRGFTILKGLPYHNV
jgi:23S rRNA (pseudouridine1915-N3)-methyltransferase